MAKPSDYEEYSETPDVQYTSKSKVYLVDIGASHDVVTSLHAQRVFSDRIRALLKKRNINTANAKVEVTEGTRVRLTDWDAIVDATMADN